MMRRSLTCVAAACDTALLGHDELLLLIQENLLPLVTLGPAYALRLGGRRLLRRWLDAATFANVALDEYTAPALYEAIQRFGASFVDRAIALQMLDRRLWEHVVYEAVADDARDVLELLGERLPRLHAPLALDMAAEQGNLQLLQWLYGRSFGGPVTPTALALAVKSGSLEVVQWVSSVEGCDPLRVQEDVISLAMAYAARGGYLRIVEFLFETFPVSKWMERAVFDALQEDHNDVADFLAGRVRIGGVADTTMNDNGKVHGVFEDGNVMKLEWLHARNLLIRNVDRRHLEYAKTHGHVGVLEFYEASLPDQFVKDMTPFSPQNAVGGSIEAARWAMVRGLLQKTIGCVYAAAKHGHIEFARWYVAVMEDAGMEFFPDYTAVGIAARRGHFECVKYMVEKGWGEATSSAMVEAATQGHRDIVEWLFGIYNSRDRLGLAMRVAAIGGHLDVLKWIWTEAHPRIGNIIATAARKGHVDVVQWMLETISPSVDEIDGAMYEAVQGGHLRVVRMLPLTDHFDAVALGRTARENGHEHVAKWIEAYRRTTISRSRG